MGSSAVFARSVMAVRFASISGSAINAKSAWQKFSHLPSVNHAKLEPKILQKNTMPKELTI